MVKVLIRLKVLESDVGNIWQLLQLFDAALFLRCSCGEFKNGMQNYQLQQKGYYYRACHTGDANHFAGRSRCFTDSLFHRLGDGNGKCREVL